MTDDRPLFISFHGGGFIGRHMDRDTLFCRRLSCKFRALVLDVDYKLAPDYPYPVAVHESRDVALWAVANRDRLRFDPKKIILIGHSSGGNLSAGVCMSQKDNPDFQPLCVVMDYPPLDLKTPPKEKPNSICDMPPERAEDYNAKYIKPEMADDPYVSPVLAPDELLEKFPPSLIISAGEDRLCVEDEEFALRLARVGREVTFKRFTESVHGFVINRMCEWEEGTELIMRFLENQLRRV